MIRGMTFFHRYKHSPACSANLSASTECSLDGRTVISDFNNLGREKHGVVRRRRPQQFDRIFGGNCAWRALFPSALHQMIGGCPIAMAIEQRANDAAIQDS